MEDFKFNIGVKVSDSITGFKGMIIARAQYLSGNNLYQVQPSGDGQENKIYDSEWINEDRVLIK